MKRGSTIDSRSRIRNKTARMLYFITGNQGKVEEIRRVLPHVEQLDIDLPEIQEMDPHAIIRAKLYEAFQHAKGEFIVEDTSLAFEGLNGLPGPLIKWFLQAVGNDGLATLAERTGNKKALARSIIGYARNVDEIFFFESSVSGDIVMPAGEFDFGWGPIFRPDGQEKTFGQMTRDEKQTYNMRRGAVEKLSEFLNKKTL